MGKGGLGKGAKGGLAKGAWQGSGSGKGGKGRAPIGAAKGAAAAYQAPARTRTRGGTASKFLQAAASKFQVQKPLLKPKIKPALLKPTIKPAAPWSAPRFAPPAARGQAAAKGGCQGAKGKGRGASSGGGGGGDDWAPRPRLRVRGGQSLRTRVKGSPKGGKAAPEGAKGGPKGGKAAPEGAKGGPKGGKAAPWAKGGLGQPSPKGKGKGKGKGKFKPAKFKTASVNSSFWTKKVGEENRVELDDALYTGVIVKYRWAQAWGFIRPDDPSELPDEVQAKLAEASEAAQAAGKEVSESNLLYFRKPDVNHQEGFKLASDVPVTFKLYVDDKGAGAYDVSQS